MINFINSEKDYIDATKELTQVFNKNVDIVENPFKDEFKVFKGFEFDRIYGEDFYNGLIDFLNNRNYKEFSFYTLLPDPVEYFFSHFSKYSIGKISVMNSYNDFMNFLTLDPGNPADDLIDNAKQ